MYRPPVSKSAKSARKPGSATPNATARESPLAASLNSRPQIRQLKENEQSLRGRPEIRALERNKEPNRTGLPDGLKNGIESLSGIAMVGSPGTELEFAL